MWRSTPIGGMPRLDHPGPDLAIAAVVPEHDDHGRPGLHRRGQLRQRELQPAIPDQRHHRPVRCRQLRTHRRRQRVAQRAVAGARVEPGARARRLVELVAGIDRLGRSRRRSTAPGQRLLHHRQHTLVRHHLRRPRGVAQRARRACGTCGTVGRRPRRSTAATSAASASRASPRIGTSAGNGAHELLGIDVDPDQPAAKRERHRARIHLGLAELGPDGQHDVGRAQLPRCKGGQPCSRRRCNGWPGGSMPLALMVLITGAPAARPAAGPRPPPPRHRRPAARAAPWPRASSSAARAIASGAGAGRPGSGPRRHGQIVGRRA